MYCDTIAQCNRSMLDVVRCGQVCLWPHPKIWFQNLVWTYSKVCPHRRHFSQSVRFCFHGCVPAVIVYCVLSTSRTIDSTGNTTVNSKPLKAFWAFFLITQLWENKNTKTVQTFRVLFCERYSNFHRKDKTNESYLSLFNLYVLCPSLVHNHTLSCTHTRSSSSHTYVFSQCSPPAPRGERFVQQQLSEEVTGDSALKVFQVIWLRCLPEAPGNGSFTFFMAGELLLSLASETPALCEPQEGGRGEGRRGQRDGSHAALVRVCAEGERQFIPIRVGLKGVKRVDERLCAYVCLWRGSRRNLLEFYIIFDSAGDERNHLDNRIFRFTLSCRRSDFSVIIHAKINRLTNCWHRTHTWGRCRAHFRLHITVWTVTDEPKCWKAMWGYNSR